jgi:hypothetical protein
MNHQSEAAVTTLLGLDKETLKIIYSLQIRVSRWIASKDLSNHQFQLHHSLYHLKSRQCIEPIPYKKASGTTICLYKLHRLTNNKWFNQFLETKGLFKIIKLSPRITINTHSIIQQPTT